MRSLTLVRNGRWLVTGSDDKTARLWDLTAQTRPASSIVLRGHEDHLMTVAISPDARKLVTGKYGLIPPASGT